MSRLVSKIELPSVHVYYGSLPKSVAFLANLQPDFQIMTMDHREWPGGYGAGSGTIYHWIKSKMEEDGTFDNTQSS